MGSAKPFPWLWEMGLSHPCGQGLCRAGRDNSARLCASSELGTNTSGGLCFMEPLLAEQRVCLLGAVSTSDRLEGNTAAVP